MLKDGILGAEGLGRKSQKGGKDEGSICLLPEAIQHGILLMSPQSCGGQRVVNLTSSPRLTGSQDHEVRIQIGMRVRPDSPQDFGNRAFEDSASS